MKYHICIDARHIYPVMDGIGRYTFNLLKELAEQTNATGEFMFSVIENAEFVSQSVLRQLDKYAHIQFVPFSHRPFTPGHLLTGFTVNALKPDVYHYTQFDLPPFVSVPVVTTIHDMNPQMFDGHFEGTFAKVKQKIARVQNAFAMQGSDILLTISETTKKEMLSLYGEKYAGKSVTVYSGFGGELKRNSPQGQLTTIIDDLKAKHNFSRYFLYVGNNRPHKNLSTLLKAFKEILQHPENKDLTFLFIGKHYPDRFTNVNAEAEVLGIAGNVRQFTVTDSELAALYNYATAFVFCSLSEGFGFPLLEAMSFGTPVICSNISSLAEIAADAAVQVAPLDTDAIAKAMTEALSQDFPRELYAERGLQRCEQFTWKQCAESTLDIYRQLALQKK